MALRFLSEEPSAIAATPTDTGIITITRGSFADHPNEVYRVAGTDDSPAFFHMLRFRDVLDRELHVKWEQGANRIQINAVSVLALVVAILIALSPATSRCPSWVVLEWPPAATLPRDDCNDRRRVDTHLRLKPSRTVSH